VVKGWAAVLSECCQLFIGGGTIEEALSGRHADEFIGLVEDCADGDKWSNPDNSTDQRPHYFEYDGYGFTAFIWLLTEAPPVIRSPLIDPAITSFNFHDAAGVAVVNPATRAATQILALVRDGARAHAETGAMLDVAAFGMAVHAAIEAAILEVAAPPRPVLAALSPLDLKNLQLAPGSASLGDLGSFRTACEAQEAADRE
jgi:hypothetical protein